MVINGVIFAAASGEFRSSDTKMTAAQRAEIRRRYADFIKRLAKPVAAKPTASKAPESVKWMPGKKAAK